jgi:hypothetical protein
MQYGAELIYLYYFSGGFTLSAGIDWCFTGISLKEKVTTMNTLTGTSYPSSTDMSFHNTAFIISAGYAFYN